MTNASVHYFFCKTIILLEKIKRLSIFLVYNYGTFPAMDCKQLALVNVPFVKS